MIANINNASYTENMTEQLTTDTDWTTIDSTTATVITEDLFVYDSTLTSLVVNKPVEISTDLTVVSATNAVTDITVSAVTYTDAGYTNQAGSQNNYITTPSGDLGSWTVDANTLPTGNLSYRTFITSTRVYILSVYGSTITVPKLYYATINLDGTLGTWVAETNLPTLAVDRTNIIVTSSRGWWYCY